MKRFEKKLDEYYTNKYIEYLQRLIFIKWDLDFKIEKNISWVKVFMKNKKYKENHYQELMKIMKDKSFYYICNFDKGIELINNIIKEYSKENK